MSAFSFKLPQTKEEKEANLRGLGVAEDEIRLLLAPLSNLIKDKALLAKADKAWERMRKLTRERNEVLREEDAKKPKQFSAPAVHTYETT